MEELRFSRFLEARSSYAEASAVIFGCPYDGTASHRPGARFGPEAIRSASQELESYSPELGRDFEELALCDLGDLELPFGNKEKALEAIGKKAREILRDGKVPLALGGEHLISLPLIEEVRALHRKLAVLIFDAHADLRDEYLGEKLSHATVARRVAEVLGGEGLYQLGVRSGTREEWRFALELGSLREATATGLRGLLKELGERPIYLSFDLDFLDPSCLPGTGAPEPGGILFRELMPLFLELARGGPRLVGMDVVELCPQADPTGVSAVMAAKVIRELVLAFFCKDN